MGLRDTVCLLRKSDPEKYRALLADQGIEVEQGDLQCRHSLDVNWEQCPFFVKRP
jgi:hypothetical protein